MPTIVAPRPSPNRRRPRRQVAVVVAGTALTALITLAAPVVGAAPAAAAPTLPSREVTARDQAGAPTQVRYRVADIAGGSGTVHWYLDRTGSTWIQGDLLHTSFTPMVKRVACGIGSYDTFQMLTRHDALAFPVAPGYAPLASTRQLEPAVAANWWFVTQGPAYASCTVTRLI